MKKKLLSALLAAAMTASLLAGCGSSDAGGAADAGAAEAGTEEAGAADTADTADADAGAAEEAKKEPVTLKTVSSFGGTNPNAPIYSAINEQFMKDNDYITVEDSSQASDEEWKAAVAADFAVGNEPDVLQFFTDATANTIVETGKLMSIEDIRKEYPDYAKDSLETSLEATKNTDGVSRAVPTTGYWEGLFCNKDLFDQYNLELPTDWASMETAIKTFKENGIIPIAVSLNNVPHYWIEFLMLYAAGPDGYTQIPETAPAEWVKGLEMFKTLRDMGAFPEDTDTVDDSYIQTLFDSKKAAMELDGNWRAGSIQTNNTDADNVVVINFPGIPDQKAEAGAIIGGISSGFYITKKAWDDPNKRDAAVKFVMAHTNKDAIQKYWQGNGIACADVAPVDNMSKLALSGMDFSKAATSVSAPTDARIDPEAYKIIVNGIVKVSTGEQSAQELLNEALKLNAERQAAK